MSTITQKISLLPPSPKRLQDSELVFVNKAEAMFDALVVMRDEYNTLSEQVNTVSGEVQTNTNTATTQAGIATTKANEASESASEAADYKNQAEAAVASLPEGTLNDSTTSLTTTWSSEKINNTKQDILISGENIKTINSLSLLGTGNIDLLPKSNPIISGSITEGVYELTGTAISPINGTIQYKTISSNITFTENLTAGQSVVLRLINGDAYTITYPTMTWVTATATTLTSNCVIVLWKEQTTLYGAFVGSLV